MSRGVASALDAVNDYARQEMGPFLQAMYQSAFALNPHALNAFATRQAELDGAGRSCLSSDDSGYLTPISGFV
jgi:hypothetical protein